MKGRAEDENQDDGCRLTPTTYSAAPKVRRGVADHLLFKAEIAKVAKKRT